MFRVPKKYTLHAATIAAATFGIISSASADSFSSSAAGCPASWAQLKSALVNATNTETSGLDFQMWGTVVNRDGIVCAVAFTGGNRGAQWPGSRVISAQKANAANAFSLDGLSLATANLFSAVQPGGSLFGLQESNPVETFVAYGGSSTQYGTPADFMSGKKIGGVNVFGGGLALYNSAGRVIGAVGVSGDTSCADHMIAWRTRANLKLDYVTGGVSGDASRPDNIIFDIANGVSAGGFGHPKCINTGNQAALPPVRAASSKVAAQ